MPRASAERPIFWIVAGPNGSGKSSAYQDADIETFARSVWIINPDLLTARIRQVEGFDQMAANVAAVERIEAWLEASIRAHQTIGVETVLSTGKYRRLVSEAKRLQFQVRLTYVIRPSVALSEFGSASPRAVTMCQTRRLSSDMPAHCSSCRGSWIKLTRRRSSTIREPYLV